MKIEALKRLHLAAIGTAFAGMLTGVLGACAAEGTIATKSVTAPQVQMAYDWLSPRTVPVSTASTSAKRRNAILQSYAGNGSYICSPSGFGKKSRCFSR